MRELEREELIMSFPGLAKVHGILIKCPKYKGIAVQVALGTKKIKDDPNYL